LSPAVLVVVVLIVIVAPHHSSSVPFSLIFSVIFFSSPKDMFRGKPVIVKQSNESLSVAWRASSHSHHLILAFFSPYFFPALLIFRNNTLS
jgi:hypothetical protein